MKLNRINLRNFRQHANTEIEFGNGLTGIIGPNGSGKTTILEAIGWALYGSGVARGDADSLRFTRATDRLPVRVELDFELAGHRYRVVRETRRAEVYLDGDAGPIATSTRGVNELLERRLGMSRTEFFNTYFTGQKQLGVMATMGPTARAQFLSRVLGYEKLRAAQELVRQQKRLILAELGGLKAAMPDPDVVARALADAERRVGDTRRLAEQRQREHAERRTIVETLAPQWEAAQRRRHEWQQLISDLEVSQSKAASLEREGQRVGAELVEIAGAWRELDDLRQKTAAVAGLRAELQSLDERYREEGRRQTLTESLAEARAELERLRERRARVEGAPGEEEGAMLVLERGRAELEASLGKLEERRTAWVRDRQEAKTKLTALLQQHADLKLQLEGLEKLGPDGACPTCSRVLGDTFTTVVERMGELIEAVVSDGKYFRGRVEQLEEMPEDIKALDERRRALTQQVGNEERALAKIQTAVQELAALGREIGMKEQRLAQLDGEIAAIPGGFDAGRHQTVRSELEQLAPLASRAERLSALVEREAQVKTEFDRISGALNAERARVRELRARDAAAPHVEEAFLELRARFESSSDEDRRAEVARVEAESELRAARDALAASRRAHEQLRVMRERSEALARDRRLHDELDRGFNALRTDLNAQLRPELSELASAFLADLTDSRYSEVEITEDYDVVVVEEGLQKTVISGGEEDIANLVLRLAISQMIADRAGQAFSLLILDEVFGSLDAVRRHNVVGLLRSLQDRFEQVILITHVDSVRDGLDRVLTVRFDETSGASRVEECVTTPEPELIAGSSVPAFAGTSV